MKAKIMSTEKANPVLTDYFVVKAFNPVASATTEAAFMIDNDSQIDEAKVFEPCPVVSPLVDETAEQTSGVEQKSRKLRVALGAGAVSLALGFGILGTNNTSAQAQEVAPSGEVPAAFDYRFVSAPDFTNADIGDVTKSPFYASSRPYTREGNPNSTNSYHEAALGVVLDAIQSEGTQDLLIAGDFVEGEWGRDSENTGIFGPTRNLAEKQRALQTAGNLYYSQARERFNQRDIRLFPAIGDHEIGDNPWDAAKGGYDAFRHLNFGLFKKTFSNHFFRNPDGSYIFPNHPRGQAAGTAYAFRPHPEVQLVSLDVFRKTKKNVLPEVDTDQLRWVGGVLNEANRDGVDWIIVQGHTPIIGPVRKKYSSGLMYAGGAKSYLWRIMARNKVDLYLAGEVHDVTARRANGILQISHGGLVTAGDANYLTATIRGSQMEIVTKGFRGSRAVSGTGRLWNTNMNQYSPANVVLYPDPKPVTRGRIIIDANNGLPSLRTGNLTPFNPRPTRR